MDPREDPRFSEGPEVKITFSGMLRQSLFSHSVNIGTDDIQALVGEGQRRLVLYLLPSPTCSKNPPFSPKNVYNEKVFIVLNLALGVHTFFLWDAMGSMPKPRLLPPGMPWLCRWKAFVQQDCEPNCHFFHKTAFLFERIAGGQTPVIQTWVVG